ncbi:MAG: hypothetical protein ACYDGR_03620 [Candidatus Dormibacteria bacterium]
MADETATTDGDTWGDGTPFDAARAMQTIRNLRPLETENKKLKRIISAFGNDAPADPGDDAATATYAALAGVLGIEWSGDSASLIKAAKDIRLSGELTKAIAAKGLDPALTRAMVDLSSVDMQSATLAADIAALVDNAAVDHPNLKLRAQVASVSGTPFPAGSGGGQAAGRITQDQLRFMSPAAVVEARRAGLLDHLGVGSK